MPIPLARCFRGIMDHAADAIMPARLVIADRLRAARLRRLVEEGRAIGLLDEGEDEVTLAWHEAQRQFRGR